MRTVNHFPLHGQEDSILTIGSSAVQRLNIGFTSIMRLSELSTEFCGSPTACMFHELNDWSCIQPIHEEWNAIRGFTPSDFIVSSPSSSEIVCADITFSIYRNDTSWLENMSLYPADNHTCITNLTEEALSPSTLYDLVLYVPIDSPSEWTWSRDVSSYTSRVPFTMSIAQKQILSSIAVHQLSFPTNPTFGCCEGYTLQTDGTDVGMCGMPSIFHYTRDLTEPDAVVPVNHTHIRAFYTIPSIPCMTNGYQATLDVPVHNWLGGRGDPNGILFVPTDTATPATLSVGAILGIVFGSLAVVFFLLLLLVITINSRSEARRLRAASTGSNSTAYSRAGSSGGGVSHGGTPLGGPVSRRYTYAYN